MLESIAFSERRSFPAAEAGRTARRTKAEREAEILGYWAGGYSSPYIEKKLFISKSTVKTHLGHIYEKTKTSNRQSLLELLENLE